MLITEADLRALFSERLSAIMKQQGVTQAELARTLEVSESTVGKWILKKSLPRMGIIQRIADYFGVRKSYFLEFDLESTYCCNSDAAALIQELEENPEYRMIISAIRGLNSESIKDIIKFIEFQKAKEEHGKHCK